MSSVYCLDTSALLDGWTRYYPPDVFPGIWRRIDDLVDDSRLIAPEEVRVELARKDDDVYAWAGERDDLFVPVDEPIQIELVGILESFPRLVNTQRNRSMADPWVVALARVRKTTVLTGEVRSGKLERPRIPDVCDQLDIPCLNFLELLRREEWTFH